MTTHYQNIYHKDGDFLDMVPLCGDACHRDWCQRHKLEYAGWDGGHETYYDRPCAQCGTNIAADFPEGGTS